MTKTSGYFIIMIVFRYFSSNIIPPTIKKREAKYTKLLFKSRKQTDKVMSKSKNDYKTNSTQTKNQENYTQNNMKDFLLNSKIRLV